MGPLERPSPQISINVDSSNLLPIERNNSDDTKTSKMQFVSLLKTLSLRLDANSVQASAAPARRARRRRARGARARRERDSARARDGRRLSLPHAPAVLRR